MSTPQMTTPEKLAFKGSLYDFAHSILSDRILHAQEAMVSAQEAANEEGKSSVGDKYEVSRAMGQIDTEMNARQLEEANKDIVHLQSVDVNQVYGHVRDGAVVVTDTQTFFISIGLGIQKVNGKEIVFISLTSPLGRAFDGQRKLDKVKFNTKVYQVREIF